MIDIKQKQTAYTKTVALRFADRIAPRGTVEEHQALIREQGFVWYGKFGAALSDSLVSSIMKMSTPKVLLIKSGGQERYWAYVDTISRTAPPQNSMPQYYWHLRDEICCWLKIRSFEPAPKDIMMKCIVISSGRSLSMVSKSSLSPFFIINVPIDTINA